MVDIALCLEHLVPEAVYYGSVTDNTKEVYDKIRWMSDATPKPKWDDVLAADVAARADYEASRPKTVEERLAVVEQEIVAAKG